MNEICKRCASLTWWLLQDAGHGKNRKRPNMFANAWTRQDHVDQKHDSLNARPEKSYKIIYIIYEVFL
jgi:hypothetical protein